MGGSGGGSTTTVDKAYNQGMLELSQEQQGMAKEMFNMYKYGVTYDPTEKLYNYNGEWKTEAEIQGATGGKKETLYNAGGKWVTEDKAIAYLRSMQPVNDSGTGGSQPIDLRNLTKKEINTVDISSLETNTRGALEGYDPKAQTSEMQYAQNLINSNQSLLGLQTATDKANLQLTKQQIEAQKTLLPQKTALSQSYLSDAAKGLNVGEKMNQAQASVQHGFKLANEANRMDIASYGLDPSSGRYAGLTRATGMAEAAGIAGARTQAQDTTEAENFRRKGLALQSV